MTDSDGNKSGAPDDKLGRREFLRRLGLLAAAPWLSRAVALPLSPATVPQASPAPASLGAHAVALLRSDDRVSAVPALLGMLGFEAGWLRQKQVVVKGNFNSADPPPGSTHLDTLRALIQQLQAWGAANITLVERSGMGNTRSVLTSRGVFALANRMDFRVVVLDDLPAREWVRMSGAHWRRGFLFPRLVQNADAVVQTCCLKTHRFGGHFTLSLKNSVGLVAKYDPQTGYNYMSYMVQPTNTR